MCNLCKDPIISQQCLHIKWNILQYWTSECDSLSSLMRIGALHKRCTVLSCFLALAPISEHVGLASVGIFYNGFNNILLAWRSVYLRTMQITCTYIQIKWVVLIFTHAPLLEYRRREVNCNIHNTGMPAFSIISENAFFSSCMSQKVQLYGTCLTTKPS